MRDSKAGTLTLADLALSAALTHAERSKIPLSSYPNIAAWFSRVQMLDAWKKNHVLIPW